MIPKFPPPTPARTGLLLAFVGLVAFGGPAAHVALMRRTVVERKHWIEPGEFNRMFAACNLIPGPSSTELAMFIGYRLAGWRGLMYAAVGFITPAMLLMLGLAALYQRFAESRVERLLLYGVRPVVVAIIGWAVLDLARKLIRERWLLAVIPVALLLYAFGFNPLLVLAAGGLAGLAVTSLQSRAVSPILLGSLAGPHPERLLPLFLTFLKLGAVSYGSGYVLFAFLDTDFVKGLHWLQPSQLVDAVALGQVTPGPVFTTATFLGYLFGGVPGALLGTLAIFLPGLILVPALDRLVRLVAKRTALRLFLEAVNAAVIGLIIAVGFSLARTALIDPVTVSMAVIAFPVIAWRPLAAPALVAVGAAIGVLSGQQH